MKFTTGYSREHPGGNKWSKMDITLEEVDIKRIFSEHGIGPETDVPLPVIFQIMWLEAERYMIIHQAQEKLVGNEYASAEIGNIRKRQNEIIDKIKGSSN